MAEEDISQEEVAEVSDSTAVDQPEAAAEQQAESQPAAPQPSDYWSAFRQLPQFEGQDERAVAARLYEALQQEQAATQALQQYQGMTPVLSEYMTNKERYQQWLQQQSQQQSQPQQQQAAQEESPWWNPPKVRDIYKQYLTRDENGREVIDPNAPLEARHALQEYQAYKAEFAKKFLENPEETLGPMIERVAVQRAESIVGEKFQRMQDEQFVAKLEQENADWLYDENRQPTAEGVAIQRYIYSAKELGINGAQARWDYAQAMVERDLMLGLLQQQQAPPQNFAQPVAQPPQPAINQGEQQAQQNMQYLRQQAMRTASQRPVETTSARVPQKKMTFEEMLAANLKQEGLV